jgi:hypothetical protein
MRKSKFTESQILAIIGEVKLAWSWLSSAAHAKEKDYLNSISEMQITADSEKYY